VRDALALCGFAARARPFRVAHARARAAAMASLLLDRVIAERLHKHGRLVGGCAMSGQWKQVCKLKDLAPLAVRLVPRGLAWQELPGVALFRGADDEVRALLDYCPRHGGPLSKAGPLEEYVGVARQYTVKIEDGRVYLDLDELNAPASQAEAALAGAFGVATRVMAFG